MIQVSSGTTLSFLCGQLNSSWQGKEVDLAINTIQPGDPMETPEPSSRLKFNGRAPGCRENTWTWAETPDKMKVWRVTGHGTSLTNGTIKLPNQGQLVFETGADGCSISGVTFQGDASVVLCIGDITFDRVTFQDCTLVATSGVSISLLACTFSNCAVAVVAAGRGTQLTAINGEINGCQEGFMVSDAAQLSFTRLTCATSAGSVLEARGQGSKAIAHACTFSTPPARVHVEVMGAGCVSICDGAVAELSRCKFLEGVVGLGAALAGSAATLSVCSFTGMTLSAVAAEQDSTVTLFDCSARDCGIGFTAAGTGAALVAHDTSAENCLYGVTLNSGAAGSFRGCRFNGSQDSCGVEVADDRTTLDCQDCITENNLRHGVYVTEGARAVLRQCQLSSSREACGVAADGRGTSLECENCTFADNCANGAVISGGATAAFEACELVRSRGSGFVAQDRGTTVQALACAANENHQCGAVVATGAKAVFRECRFAGSVEGHGVDAACDGTAVECHGCTSADNKQCGASFSRGARGVLKACQLTGSCLSSGVEAADKGTLLDVSDCELEGNQQGGLTVFAAKVVASNCHSSGNGAGGYYAVEDASLALQRCTSANEPCAFFADVSSKLSRKRCSPPTSTKSAGSAKSQGVVRQIAGRWFRLASNSSS